MAGDRFSLLDTSLRDGGQTPVVDCTVADKQAIARALDGLRLLEYEVRILPPSSDGDGTETVTRVMIESGEAAGQFWRTAGVSGDIINASLRALDGSLNYKLMRGGVTPAAP